MFECAAVIDYNKEFYTPDMVLSDSDSSFSNDGYTHHKGAFAAWLFNLKLYLLTGEEYFKEASLVEMWNEIPINCIGVIFDYKNKRVKNLIENEIKEKKYKDASYNTTKAFIWSDFIQDNLNYGGISISEETKQKGYTDLLTKTLISLNGVRKGTTCAYFNNCLLIINDLKKGVSNIRKKRKKAIKMILKYHSDVKNFFIFNYFKFAYRFLREIFRERKILFSPNGCKKKKIVL